MSGTLITLAGIAWWLIQYRFPKAELPRLEPWHVMALGIALLFYSGFNVWRTSHRELEALKAETNEKRPRLSPGEFTRLDHVDVEAVDARIPKILGPYSVRVEVKNTGGRPVSDLTGYIVVMPKTLNEAPLLQQKHGTANDIGVNQQVYIGTQLFRFGPEGIPPEYVVIYCKYLDATTKAKYIQTFYFLWPGAKPKPNGDLEVMQPLFNIDPAERESIKAYLAQRGFEVEN